MEIRAKAADARFKLACCQLPCNNNANTLRLMMSCRLGKSCCPCQMRLPRWAWQLVWCFPLQVASSQPTPLSCWCTCMRKGRDAWYAHTCNAIESDVAEQHSVLRCADTTCYTVCSKFATLTMQHVHAAHTCCAYMLHGANISTVVLGPTVRPSYQLVVLTRQVYLSPACATKELHRSRSEF